MDFVTYKQIGIKGKTRNIEKKNKKKINVRYQFLQPFS